MNIAARRLLVWTLLLAALAVYLDFALVLNGGWIARYGATSMEWFAIVYSDPVRARFALDYMVLFNIFAVWAILEIPQERRFGLWTWLWLVGMFFATAASVMWYFLAQKQHHLATLTPFRIGVRKHKMTSTTRLLLLANLVIYSALYSYFAFTFKGGWLANPGFWLAIPQYLLPMTYDGYLGTAIFDYLVLIPVCLVWALSELPREQRAAPRTIIWSVVYLAFPGLGILLYFLWLQPGNHLASGEAMNLAVDQARSGITEPAISGTHLPASA